MSRNSVQTDWVLSNIPSDYKLILVGDAQMAPHELLAATTAAVGRTGPVWHGLAAAAEGTLWPYGMAQSQ